MKNTTVHFYSINREQNSTLGGKKKKELEKAEPLTQKRINAIKVISKEVTEYY